MYIAVVDSTAPTLTLATIHSLRRLELALTLRSALDAPIHSLVLAARRARGCVDEVTDRRVKLNYGTPLLTRGAVVLLEGPGGEEIKCTIGLAGNGYAWAETRGTGDIGGVEPGSVAVYAEADSPEANSPTFERVDLPF